MRVLHVDDECVEQTANRLECADDRLTVCSETDPQAALQRIQTERVDCVISGYRVRGIDGLELFEQAREIQPGLPFVFYTGWNPADVVSGALTADATEFVRKSTEENDYEYNLLAKRVTNVVAQSHTEQRQRDGRLEEVIRAVQSALVNATTREEVDTAVCETIVDSERYAGAWIGEYEEEDDRVVPRMTAGVRTEAHTKVTVSLSCDEKQYGVLTIATDRPTTVSPEERELFDHLGETITHAYDRVRTQKRYEGQYRELFEDAPVMIAFTREEDGEPLIEDCNQRFANKLGYTVAELRDRPLAELYTEESAERLLSSGYERALESDFTPKEREFLTADGEQLSTLLQASPRLDNEGEVVGTHALYVDVTSHKRAQKVLKRAGAMEASIDGVAILNENEEYIYLNQAHAKIYGYDDPEPLLGTTWRELYEDTEIERFEDEVFPALEDDGEWRGEATGLRADGTTFPQELSLSYFEGGDIVCIVRDITAQKERERTLRASKQSYQDLFENIHEMVFVHDHDGNILSVNQAACETLGYNREVLEDRHMAEIHPEEFQVPDKWDIKDESPKIFEVELETSDGQRLSVAVSLNEIEFFGCEAVLGVARDVTEQREKEAYLEKSQEVGNIGWWRKDMSTDQTIWSDRVYEMWGVEEEKRVIGDDTVLELLHPDDREDVDEQLAAALKGEPYDVEHRIVTPDGEVRWMRQKADVNFDESGEPVSMIGIVQDITEQKVREQELQQFREAVEETAHAVYITDRDGRIEYANPAVTEITGYGEKELLGARPSLFGSGEYDDSYYEVLWDTVLSGEKWQNEIIDERKDGEQIVLDQTITPITGPDGEISNFVAVARDVTDRKRREESLERAHNELRKVIDLVPDQLFVKNRDGEYVLANEATADIYGLSPMDLEGKTDFELLPSKQQVREFREDDLEVINSGEPKRIPQKELTTADGETRLFQTTKIPYEVAETGEDAVLSYARDVTDLKAYEQRLERQRDNLSMLNQIVRHDIRNELQLVLAYTETLEEYVKEGGQQYVEQVLNSARNAVEITEEARDVAQVTLKGGVEPTSVDLLCTLNAQIDEVRSSYESAVIQTRGELPAVDVVADNMLDSVFRNLLKNAIEHNDSEVPEVTVSVTDTDDHVVIHVADNGPGIPDERKDSVFERGEMGLESDGTGLGLYLVETLVDGYGGTVWIEDNDPNGTVFNVELPLTDR
ncbi:PAS domain S-box protein [Natrarchaeobaculum sulfurireducens]|uniref:histidine kinase n=1 Tax=Natrarchaeobaculum sulfurireducens TaxID=2044521 RepID=A0A346PKE3_9EURY|nr:PAS domain S-box protein [Natrarchaeobaculum sulfurireducens]AXR79988.1 Signal transduction histidine kinase [Natrarchaeobaculum sulfurireducens]